MKKQNCSGHCICYFGGATSIPPFHEGLAGQCCNCGEINPDEEKVKERVKENALASHREDIYFNIDDFMKAVKKRYN